MAEKKKFKYRVLRGTCADDNGQALHAGDEFETNHDYSDNPVKFLDLDKEVKEIKKVATEKTKAKAERQKSKAAANKKEG